MAKSEFFINNIPINSNVKCLHLEKNGVLYINGNNKNNLIHILITKEGIYKYGDKDEIFSIYTDNNNNYYLVRNQGNINEYMTFGVKFIKSSIYSSCVLDYEENFSTSNLTKLEQLNYNDNIKYINQIVEGNETLTYNSLNIRGQYIAESSLILISARNTNNNNINLLYFMHKVNDSSINNYTLTLISGTENNSLFNIQPTQDGFTVTPTVKSNIHITEIANHIK